jgi:hypothetical protein
MVSAHGLFVSKRPRDGARSPPAAFLCVLQPDMTEGFQRKGAKPQGCIDDGDV